MARLLGVLQTLGAVRQRDGGLVLELAPLELTSLFGGALVGAAHCGVQGDALAFKTPPELAACGRLWLPDIADDDALVAAIAEAHGELRQRINDAFATLRRLGFKARLQAPEPRARGFVVVDGAEVMVAIDTSGDLVVESVDGIPIGNDGRRSLVAPEEATAAEALALLRDVVKATHRPAPAMMSQEEFAELQAALSDDDDFGLDSDEAEPTAAGVPLPTKRPAHSSFEQSGTLQVPMLDLQQLTIERRINDDDSDAGTTKAYSPQAAPPPQMTREASLLDEFDDDDVPPPPPVPSRVDIDVDFNSDEDGFDEPEPTATRPVSTPQQTVQRREPDSEESDLLAALGDNSAAEMPPPGHGFGFDDDDDDFGSPATSVNGSATPAPAALSMLPARVPPAQRNVSNVDSTAAYPAAVTRQEQPQVTDDDFDDGKTRALVVDEALLARLKLGDAQEAASVVPSEPARPTVHVEDLDIESNAVPRADNDLASMLDDEPFVAPPSDFDDGRTIGLDANDPGDDGPFNPSNTLALAAEPQAVLDVELITHAADVHAARLSSLIERERELLTELQAVQAELAALRSAPPPPPPPPAPAPARVVQPPPQVHVEQFAAVGDSAEGAPEWDTNAMRASASLPSMASVDVHEIESRASDGHSSILDAFDDDDAPSAGVESDDDVVSLAALQGALKEMGVDLGDGNATQVAAAIPFPMPADVGGDSDGDVFGSGLGSVLPRRVERTSTPSAASELSVEATRVRQARPAAIGLVVEDERARQRLRKHLVDRFAELFEADDATSAMQQRTFSDVDAIVFIRPSDTDRTRSGFSRLEALPRRPRVLVISTDERFDDSPAVDLRLPLAQKASDVARQVLEGLERLGVQTSAV